MAEELRELGAPASTVRVHHFGVDYDYWSRITANGSDRASAQRILMVASFVEKKGHLDLIRAFADVCGSEPGAMLRLVGSGPLESAARALVQELGLGSQVSFAGFIPHGDRLAAEYRDACVYVHPSRTASDGDQEGLPTTILEAMASGLPIVSTVHAGIPDAVDPQSGLLLGEGDISGLARALVLLLREPGRRESMGEAGRSRVHADFNLTTQSRRLEFLYDEASAGTPERGERP
jgi:colanic acid/amylovoran biosynthesis glycosyltransferase